MKWIKYISLTIFFFFSLVFTFSLFRGDTFANYGFSYAISLGEIPYKDFNMVITPFSPLLYSIGLFFHKSILMYYFEQSLLLTLLFVVMKKMLENRVYLFFTLLCILWPISFPTILFPGYNFICFLLLMILIDFEEEKRNDYIIGFFLGLLFCTKQTIGLLALLPSCIVLLKDYRRLLKRIGGFLVPFFLLLIYLWLTNSIKEWFDLCFLGLFSFGSKNNSFSIINILFLILGLMYIIYNIKKDNKKIINYYFLSFIIVALPIIDYYHIALFLLGPLFLIVREVKIDYTKKLLIPIFIILYSLNGLTLFLFLEKPVIVNWNHFPLYVVNEKYKESISKLNQYLQSQEKRKVFLLRGSENYMFKIMNDEKITYYDLPNYGNYGSNDEKRIEEEINNMHNVLFIIDSSLCIKDSPYQQFICSFKEKAMNNSNLIKKINQYEVYERE